MPENGTSLAAKLMLALTLLAALIMGVMGSYWLQRQKQIASTELEIRAERMADLLGKTLSGPVWNIDLKTIREQLKSAMTDPQLHCVALYEEGRDRLLASETRAGQCVDAVRREAPVVYVRDLPPLTATVGKIRLAYSREHMYAELNRTRMLIAAAVLLQLISLSLATCFLLDRMVKKPVGKLVDMSRRIADGDFSIRIPVKSRDELGTLAGTFNVMADELQRTVDGMTESREHYLRLFENSPISLWEKDYSRVGAFIDSLRAAGIADFRTFFETHPESVEECIELVTVLSINKATLSLVGADDKEQLLAGLSMFFTDESMNLFREEIITLAEGGRQFTGDSVHRTLTGEIKYVTEYFAVLPGFEDSLGKVVVSLLDVTEHRKAEEALALAREDQIRREKLSILGQLAGTVGHELRNPLGVMNNAVYFLKMVLTEADETTREYLGIIQKEIDNSQRIITDLLDFTRTRTPLVQEVGARELVSECAGRCVFPENVTLQIDIPDDLPIVRVDPQQMGQVLQNLIMNGIEAMPYGGELRIGAGRVRGTGLEGQGIADKNFEPRTSGLDPDGDFVEISVADTGVGITAEGMKRLFQPLFTTKAKGTGLGLTVCKNLTEANGGRIEVASEEGKGTCFTVQLPVGERGR